MTEENYLIDCLTYSILNTPSYLADGLRFCSRSRAISHISHFDLVVLNCRTSAYQHSFAYAISSHSLPRMIKETDLLTSFRYALFCHLRYREDLTGSIFSLFLFFYFILLYFFLYYYIYNILYYYCFFFIITIIIIIIIIYSFILFYCYNYYYFHYYNFTIVNYVIQFLGVYPRIEKLNQSINQMHCMTFFP